MTVTEIYWQEIGTKQVCDGPHAEIVDRGNNQYIQSIIRSSTNYRLNGKTPAMHPCGSIAVIFVLPGNLGTLYSIASDQQPAASMDSSS